MSESTQPPPDNAPHSAGAASAQPPPENGGWRKLTGWILSILFILGAVVLTLWVWSITERYPRTDDAVARANVVGIAPRVHGQIIKVNVQDNQAVKEGDLLFEIDPEDFKLALDKATGDLATLDQQIEVARAQDAELKFQVKVAAAAVEAAKAELYHSSNTLQRMLPLLPKGFATADNVEKAQTLERVAASNLASEEQRLNQAKTALSALATLLAQRASAEAVLKLARLQLSYCKVVAPFPGRVVNLNISAGAFAEAGIPVFSLLDTRKWYVMAEFREGEIRHFTTGASFDVYLLSAPDRHFAGRVQGIGWAVVPTGELDVPHGLPLVRRELNWVHIAQRFPVRIEIENPDPNLFRMGASAVAILKSTPDTR